MSRKLIYSYQAVRHRVLQIFQALWKALVDTVNHDGIEHAGYLAFLSLLSFFPFLVFFVAIVGALGESELGVKLIHLVLYENDLVPPALVQALEPRIKEILSGPPQGLLTLAIIGAIWTASSAVEGIRTTLNRAYRVETPPAYIFRRLMSIAQFLVLTVFLIISMLVLVLAPLILQAIIMLLGIGQDADIFGMAQSQWTLVRYGFTVTILFLVVCAIYYVLPNIKMRWQVVVPGAVLTVLGWVLAGEAFASYLQTFDQVNIIYGSLGGIIVSLLFSCIFSMILIYGAEFNYTLNHMLGRKIEPRQLVRSRIQKKQKKQQRRKPL